MRYRTKVGGVRVLTWIAYGALVTANLSARRLPLWLALLAGLFTVLAFFSNYHWTYWEVLPDRVIERRLFRRSVMMFFEIVSIRPTPLIGQEVEPQPHLIAVRGVAGRRMVVYTPQARQFLKEMLEHLPPLPPPALE